MKLGLIIVGIFILGVVIFIRYKTEANRSVKVKTPCIHTKKDCMDCPSALKCKEKDNPEYIIKPNM